MPRASDFPASNFVRFLSSYGPDSSNVNMFDENVRKISSRYGIEPFELKTEYVNEIVRLLRKDEPSAVLIAGVAGDGKSFLLRKVWEQLGGSSDAWAQVGDQELDITIEDGSTRTITFIKDLSATEHFDLQDILSIRNDRSKSIVIACNHGQILSRLRDQDLPEHKRVGQEQFAKELENIFFEARASRSIGFSYIFDLSRTSQANRLKEIIELVATHKKWEICSEKQCPYLQRCPIRQNVAKLWDCDKNVPTRLTKQLCELVNVAGYDGNHFPIRELFLLVINAILGISGGKGALGNCHTVKHIEEDSNSARFDIFQNLLGRNLKGHARDKKAIFVDLDSFDVGNYSDPFFDNVILLGRNHPNSDIRSLFNKYLQDYSTLPDVRDEDARVEWIRSARTRLFFTWDEPPAKRENVWRMTAYAHTPKFIRMREEAKDDSQIPESLLKGLNRAMTGSALLNQSGVVSIATIGASSRDPVGLLVVGKFASQGYHADVRMIFDDSASDAVPCLEFSLPDRKTHVFALTPKRYEFLMSLSEGLISTSFSSQCQSEFYSLKAILVSATRMMSRSTPKKVMLEFVNGRHIAIKVPAGESYV